MIDPDARGFHITSDIVLEDGSHVCGGIDLGIGKGDSEGFRRSQVNEIGVGPVVVVQAEDAEVAGILVNPEKLRKGIRLPAQGSVSVLIGGRDIYLRLRDKLFVEVCDGSASRKRANDPPARVPQ